MLVFCKLIIIDDNILIVWTQTILSRFRWLWFDVTTYSPYSLETSYEGSLLLSGVGSNVTSRGVALALSGLLHVARSLTSNARGVFRILAERHIEDKENKENDRIEGNFEILALGLKDSTRFKLPFLHLLTTQFYFKFSLILFSNKKFIYDVY